MKVKKTSRQIHSNRHSYKCRKKHSAGFSVLEILIATVLIGTLIAGGVYYANIGQKVNAVDLVSLKTSTVVRFPEAVVTIYSEKQSLLDVDAGDLTATGSVQTDKPVVWAVASGDDAPTKNSISVIFTLTNDEQANNLSTYLNDNLDTTMVSDAEVGTGENSNRVTVKYEIT